MTQTAKVIELSDPLCKVEVSRKAMCDGCHKMRCNGKCAMSGLMASGNKMTALAHNKAGAKIGDSVIIESSDKDVLCAAALVFILPLVLGCLLYAVALALDLSYEISVAAAVIGVVCVFPIMRIFEKRLTKKTPRLTIIKIVAEDNKSSALDED